MREHRLVALLALTLGVFLVTLNVTVVVVALPAIQADLHVRSDQATWIIDAYNLVGASLLLSAGFLADRFGRKRMLCTGYALFAGGALLCALAPSGGWLIAFRVVQALGGTALTPTSLSIVANLFPEPLERARAIGIWGISSGLGTGPRADRRRLAHRLAGLALGVRRERDRGRDRARDRAVARSELARGGRPEDRRARTGARRGLPRDPDLRADRGAPLRLHLDPDRGRSSRSPACCSSPSSLVELRVDEPLIDLGFFRDRQFSGAVFITVATFFTYSGFIFFNALYLQDVRGYSALAAGFLTLPAAVPAVIGGPLGGYLVGTRGPRGVMIGGHPDARGGHGSADRPSARASRSAGCSWCTS